MKTIRLRTYLFVMLGLIAGSPAFMLGTTQARRWSEVQALESDHETLFAAQALARQIGQLLDGHVRSVALLAARLKMGSMSPLDALARQLSEHRVRYGAFVRLSVIGVDGTLLASDPPAAQSMFAADSVDLAACRQGLDIGGPAVTQVVSERATGQLGIRIAVPLRRDAGDCLLASVPSEDVQALIQQTMAEYSGLRAVVVDANQTLLAGPDDALGRKLAFPFFLPPGGRAGESRRGFDDAGVPVRGGVAPIRTDGIGWTVVVYRTQAEVEAGSVIYKRQTLIASLMAASAAVLMALLLSLWLSRPIDKLASFALQVKRGDRSCHPPQQSRWHAREVSQLVDAVSSMAGQLEAHADDLERQVKARTADLAENLDKLNRTQEQLLQAGKMVAVGQLAGGVAHEINNPLAVILGFAQGLERRVPEGDPLRMPVTSIAREALRCKALVQELLTFSRVAKKTTEPVMLNELVRATSVLVESRARTQNVQLAFDLCDEVGVVSANKTQIQQVLVNLSTNAMDAMNGGGRLTFRTRCQPDQVLLEVSDTGAGMPAEVRARIFEPFFTTKEPGKGTGLGLSLVYEILQQHGGAIEVNSEPGSGTTMSVRLPAVPEARA